MINRTAVNASKVNCAPINGAHDLLTKRGEVSVEYLKLDIGRLDYNKLR